MLDYTKAALKQTFADLKKAAWWIKLSTQAIYIVYLIYALCVQTGVLAANITLLAISLAYLAFFLHATALGKLPDGKPMQKTVKTVYTVTKRVITLFTLGVAVYALFATSKHLTVVSLLFTALMIVGWVLGVAFDLIIKVVFDRVQLLTEALEADIEQVTKPVRAVGNFFKKVTGKEVEPQKEPTKNRVFLDKKVAENKAEEKRKKEEAKLLKKQQRRKKQPVVAQPTPTVTKEKKPKQKQLTEVKESLLLPEATEENK